MKKICLSLILASGLFSCAKDDDAGPSLSGVVGDWELIEVYNDPGDGSGQYEPVDTEKTISFFEDGTLSTNGKLCLMTTWVGDVTRGTYSLADSSFHSPRCDTDYDYNFAQKEDILVMIYPCIHPCLAKYRRL